MSQPPHRAPPNAPASAPAAAAAVRRFAPADAAGVCACAAAIYGDRYPRRELTDAAALVEQATAGRWHINVARDGDGTVLGFSVLQPCAHGPLAEYGMVMVRPEGRRAGVAERLRDDQLRHAASLGLAGYYCEVGTVHTAAQAIAERAGIVPCGLSLAHWPDRPGPDRPDKTGPARHPPGQPRLSFVRYLRCLRPPPPVQMDLPPHHRAVAAAIAEALGRRVRFTEGTAAGATQLSQARQPEVQCLFIEAVHIGADAGAQLASIAADFAADASLDTAYLDLPVTQPGAAALCLQAEALGFFFGGLTPWQFGRGDGLRLQRLKGDPALAPLRILNPFAQRLLQHALAEHRRCGISGSAPVRV